MAGFSTIVVTKKGAYTFRFSKIEGHALHKYFVSVVEGTQRITSFDMKLNNKGQWKVVEPAPDYIMDEERRLAASIEENLTR